MGVVEDGVEELKKMPVAGRIAVVVALGGAIAVGVYVHSKSTAGATSSVPVSATGGDTSGMTSASDFNPPSLTTGVPAVPSPTTPTMTPTQPVSKVNTTPPPKKPAPPPTKHIQSYVVQRGDSLSAIAAHFHLKGGWQSLYNANRGVIGSNPNLIKPGQKLTIPS